VLAQYALTRAPDLPDVPLITDLAKTTIDKQALAVILLPQEFGFPFAAPPGLLPEVTDMLRAAFLETMRDPQVIEEVQRIKLALHPVGGADLQRLIREAHAASPETIARARALIAPGSQ
jgi:tripartite-type tricarboxylate transporter receptor subunit TctC